MNDTYLESKQREILGRFCSGFPNVIGPMSGRAACPAQTLETGVVLPARAAIGDPALFYACVRTEALPPLPEGISLADEDEGKAVLGVWG